MAKSTKYNRTKRVCKECGGPAKFFYRDWYCTHTTDLKGLCKNQKQKEKLESNND